MTILVGGDIHGRYYQFTNVLRHLEQETLAYPLVLLGDYVGYGNQSAETLRLVKSLVQEHGVMAVMGNWEDMVWRALRSRSAKERGDFRQVLVTKEFGTGKTLRAIEEAPDREELLDFIESLPTHLVHEETQTIFSHTGVVPDIWEPGMSIQAFAARNDKTRLRATNLPALYWNEGFYEKEAARCLRLPFRIVAGHKPVQAMKVPPEPGMPWIHGNVVDVDLGASRKAGQVGILAFLDDGRIVPAYVQNVVRDKTKGKTGVRGAA